ncbi:hypothetical protein DSL72_006693 [Monilinia vaccinii-corymbosi]|uniref:Uncharacterized protein n=1 Tax=Monilinia vaccinii-corymbosi TaxID=61207 RepID=A0A8A3PNU0_9HELO|nr:hypothetical protein DSL72_006693 [Monilinia vaccinii-corymbosi]
MAHDDGAQRKNGHKRIDPPIPRHEDGAHDHAGRHGNAEDKRVLEFAEQTRDLFEEGDIFDFLGGGAPGHVDLEEVAEERLGDVHGEAAEEHGHEEEPFEVFED